MYEKEGASISGLRRIGGEEMKNYLNKQERMDYVMLSATAVATEKLVSNWGEHGNLTKDERKYLKMAGSLVIKVMKSILSRLPIDQRTQLARTAESTMCVCVPQESQYSFRKRLEKEQKDEELIIKHDALDELAGMALERCCKDCAYKGDQMSCPCRQIFLELDIPPYDSQAKGCPWEMEVKKCG